MKWQHIPFGAVIVNAGIVALLERTLTITKLFPFASPAVCVPDGVLRDVDITNGTCVVAKGLWGVMRCRFRTVLLIPCATKTR
jgi:hypothetical protein